MINLKKGQKINLKKDVVASNGSVGISDFYVGCNWGKIKTSKMFGLITDLKEVDLDLSALLFDEKGEMVDYVYSPFYRIEFLSSFGYQRGKLASKNGAIVSSGDDREGDDSDDNLDNEIISVDLKKIAPDVKQIYFFLNYCDDEDIDFSVIPYAKIRIFEGSVNVVKQVYAEFNLPKESSLKNCKSLIMGRLYLEGNEWKYEALGTPLKAENICATMNEIRSQVKALAK
jgi:tellurium resistance protein TerZ